jgi:membrane protease YdiL (CAAX protease family)
VTTSVPPSSPGGTRAGAGFLFVASIAWAICLAVGRTYEVLYAVQGACGLFVIAGVATLHGRALLDELRPRAVPLAVGFVVGAATAGATVVLWPVVRDVVPGLRDEVRAVYGAAPFAATYAPLLLLAILGEEALWRALAFDLLRARGVVAAVVGSSVLYGAAQLGALTWVTAVVALGFGALWAGMRAATRSLWPSAIAHAIWTFTVVVLRLE